jgi:isochorismate synthase EntC
MRVTDVSQLDGRLISTARQCPDLPLVEFLRRAYGERRVHWENAREPLAFAGYGATIDLVAGGNQRFRTMQTLAEGLFADAHLHPHAKPVLFGGFAFRSDFTPQVVWQGMEAAHLVLPRVLLQRDGEQHWLILSEYVSGNVQAAQEHLEQDIDGLFDDLFWNFSGEHWNPAWEEASDIEYPMGYDDWARMITNATDQMGAGQLDKVVLSRMCQIRFSNPVNVVRALEYLREAYSRYTPFLVRAGATQCLLRRNAGDHSQGKRA